MKHCYDVSTAVICPIFKSTLLSINFCRKNSGLLRVAVSKELCGMSAWLERYNMMQALMAQAFLGP